MGRFQYTFPKWTNLILPMVIIVGMTAPLYVAFMVAWGFSPATTDVGYMPTQPVPFSHRVHAGELGIDCRYCHNTVEYAAVAAIPPTATCMNCHVQIHPESVKLAPLHESYETGMPMQWIKVHDMPDYAYFDHSAHVTRGVSCVECHGRIDTMETVYQHERLSMGWCLDAIATRHLMFAIQISSPSWNGDGTWVLPNDWPRAPTGSPRITSTLHRTARHATDEA